MCRPWPSKATRTTRRTPSWGSTCPQGTPAPVIDTLNRATNEVLADHRVREKMLAMAVERVGGTPKAYAAFLAAEYEKMGRLIEEGRIVLKE